MKNITLRQFKVFDEVARRLSFAQAARALHLTAPAVTMQIKEMENAVGLPLFDRSGRVVSLTTTGEYLLVYARRMLATLKEADDAMARLKQVESGILHVGLVSTAKYFVPRLLARFRTAHPGVELRLHVSSNRAHLVALLQDKEIDLAIMGRPPRELAARSEVFAAHPLVFVAPPDHPLIGSRLVAASLLAVYPFIVREQGSGTRRTMEDYFKDHGCSPYITMEMSSNETIKQAVMAGMGVSFLSLHTLGLELQHGLASILRVEGTPMMRNWHIVHLTSKLLSPAADAFRQFMIAEAELYLGEHDRPLLAATFPRTRKRAGAKRGG